MLQVAENIADVDSVDSESDFERDVINGLSSKTKAISPKYFYDELGSGYFDEICNLQEYYPYRTELKLLSTVANDLASRFLKPVSIVEFGAGSLVKIQPLLEAMPNIREFIPIDISGEHLFHAANKLRKSFPNVHINPTQADFCHPVSLSTFRGDRLGYFPGSTIGNFTPENAQSFLSSARKTLGQHAYMLIGVDTKKSPQLLHNAYNDAKGVTAKFNLNLLSRINRELDGNFDLDTFDHYAYYNPSHGRIEMHLVSSCNQLVNIGSNEIEFNSGETIHTECSYKYAPEEFTQLAGEAGWAVETSWFADQNMFGVYLLRADSLTRD